MDNIFADYGEHPRNVLESILILHLMVFPKLETKSPLNYIRISNTQLKIGSNKSKTYESIYY